MRNRMIKLALLSLCLATRLGASAEDVGTTVGSFTKLGLGARAAGLADAAVADSQDPSDIAFNPAGLARSRSLSLQATHLEWFQGARMESLAGSFSMGSLGSLGAALSYIGLPSQDGGAIQGNLNDPNATLIDLGGFSPNDMSLHLGYGKRLNKYLDLGAALRMASESIASSQAMAYTADLGVLAYLPDQPFVFGLSVQNLGPPSSMGSESFAQPMLIRGGVRYDAMQNSGHSLKLMAEVDLPLDNALALAVGGELQLYHRLFARLGYRQDSIFNSWTAGLGLVATREFSMDMAVAPAGDLGLTYRASLNYGFGDMAAAPGGAKGGSGEPSGPLKVSLKLLTRDTLVLTPGARWQVSPSASPAPKLKRWALYVYAGSKVIRQIGGPAPMPDLVEWDGKDNQGNPVAQGSYPLRLGALDKDGKPVYSMESAAFRVSRELPKLTFEFDANSRVPEDQSKLYVPTAFQIRSNRAQAGLLWKLEILSPEGGVFRSLTGDVKELSAPDWDGKSTAGQDYYSNYDYGFRLSLTDLSGNTLWQGETLTRRCVFRR